MQRLVTKAKFARMCGVNASTVTRACESALKPAVSGKKIDANHPTAVAYLEKHTCEQTAPVAAGMDALDEQAVKFVRESGVTTIAGLQGHLDIGHKRASKMIGIMKTTGVIKPKQESKPPPRPSNTQSPPPPPYVEPKTVTDDVDLDHVPEEIRDLLDMTLSQLIKAYGTSSRLVDWLNATQKIMNIEEKRLKNEERAGKLVDRELIVGFFLDPVNSAHLRMMKDGAKTIAAGTLAKHNSGATLPEIEVYISDLIGSFITPVKDKMIRALKDV